MVFIKIFSNYATCSSNNWVKLRWQTKLPMALNGLITAVITQTFNSIVELVISIGITIKEEKAEMEHIQ